MKNEIDELAGLRDEIDAIDDRIVKLIAERIRTAENVAAVKSSEGADLVDETREEDVKAHYEERFRQRELDAESGRALAEFLIEVSIEREKEIEGGS